MSVPDGVQLPTKTAVHLCHTAVRCIVTCCLNTWEVIAADNSLPQKTLIHLGHIAPGMHGSLLLQT